MDQSSPSFLWVSNTFRTHSYLLYFCLLATLTTVLLISFLLFSYQQTENTIKISSSNEAHILASQLDTALRRIHASSDLVTENILYEALLEPISAHQISRINNRLNALGRYFPEVLGHLFFDAEGLLVFSSDPALDKISIADRDYFKQIKEHPESGVFFSETLSAKTTQTHTVVAYQALLGSTGNFLGIIATPIDLRFFEELFSRMDVGSQGMVSIRRSDNSRLVVRWPDISSGLNKEARDIPPQQQIQAGVKEGVVRYIGRTDGVDRIFAFHRISHSPFYVLVGRAISEQFAGWYKVAAISSALTCAGILLLGFFLYRLKKSELNFRQSEIQYQAVVESQLDAVCRWLPDTTLTFVNAKYKELFASDNKTLIGHRWVEFGLPDKRETTLSTYSRLKEYPKPFSTENSVTSSDGSTRYFHWITVPLLDGKGECIEFQSVGRDITELKQAEVSLRESEARIRAITDTAMDAILMMDPSGHVAYWNPAAERIFGYTKDEAIGMDLHGLIAPLRYHESYKKALVEFQKTGQGNAINTTLEMEACHKDGHEISIELSLTALHFREGWLSTGIIRDITNRKQAEVALMESEERFKILHDASFGGIFIHDQGIILDCNQGLSELTGYTFEELVGMDGLMLFAPEWRELVIKNIRSGFEQLYEVEALRKDGTIYPLSIRGKAIPYKGRAVRVAEFRDITERKQAEEERKSLQMQLIQAQKMEAIGTLAGGIAHDFNNILGAILGYTEIACDDIPPESNAIKHLGKVLEASHRASSLVKQILVFSRQADAEHVALQPSVIIKEAIKLLRPSLPSTITIKQQIDHATKLIFADPTQVHQILMNLCTNAFHAMEQTGGTLEIVLKNCEFSQNDLKDQPGLDSGNFVALSVRDTGPGIEEKIREKIFEPYFTTKEMGKGTGMGLAIVHGIVNSYGGYITCESEVGKGTVFNILFPAIDEEIVTELNPIETVPTGNERILYIDDEKMLADLGKAMLTRLGYEVTVQTSSLEALDMFRNHPEQFDAVITDQTMPGMTGINLARELLQIRPDIPIVICTGYSNLITKEQVIAEGIGGFVLKPLNREKIATLLRKVLDSDKLPGQSPFQA